VTAALLGAAVARSAAIFVADNVRGASGDPRITRARAAAAEADAAAQRAIGICPQLDALVAELETGTG
jgi:hypothetical protein